MIIGLARPCNAVKIAASKVIIGVESAVVIVTRFRFLPRDMEGMQTIW